MLKNNCNYSRKTNIIYQNDVPIIQLKQKFIDVEKLSPTGINYMNKYMEMFPELFEKIEQKEKESSNQLSLF